MKYLSIHTPLWFVLWIGLYLDSYPLAQSYLHTQWITNLFVISTFVWIYRQVSSQVKQLMFYGVIVAFGGEVFFSLVLDMYTYRLENLPLYVPFGHAIVYASVYYLVKEPLVQKYQKNIIRFLYIGMIIYSTLWLIFAMDVFGFLCMFVILWLFKRRPQTKLFFLLMFFTIVYLELLGTHYQCWHWPSVWFDTFTWIPSANPPSGISVFYFAFDAGCLWFYKRFNPAKWQRFKRFKVLKSSSSYLKNSQLTL